MNLSAHAAVVRMKLLGANPRAHMTGDDRLTGKANYLIGRDPAGWVSDIPTFGRVRYEDVYAGVDLVYYGRQGQLEYDIIVHPDADPGQVRWSFDGVDRLELDENAGDLFLDHGRWSSSPAEAGRLPGDRRDSARACGPLRGCGRGRGRL